MCLKRQPLGPGLVVAGVRDVSAVFVVDFTAGDGRVEGTDQSHVFGATTQRVRVVLVQRVKRAIGNLVGFASGLVVDAAVTGDTIYSFKVMLVPEVQLGARKG